MRSYKKHCNIAVADGQDWRWKHA